MRDKPEWEKVMQEKLQAYLLDHNEKMQSVPEYRKQHEVFVRMAEEDWCYEHQALIEELNANRRKDDE